MTILAIDQGTSSTKAIVVDPEDGICGVAEIAVQSHYFPGGGVEQDPAELLASVLQAGRAAIASAGRPVSAVSLANQGETVLAWDPVTGHALTQAIIWQDRRAEDVCTNLAAQRELFATRTGLMLDPYFSAPKMAWLRRNVEKRGVVTTSDTWLLHQLTGEFVTDAATASRSLLVDLGTTDWDQELLALFELDSEPLPDIVANDIVIGTTSVFGTDIPVCGVIVDQQAALLAESCFEAGLAKCTFGTGAFLLVNTGATPAFSHSGLSSSIAWQIAGRNTFCVDGQIYTAAAAVNWLCTLGIITDAAELDTVAAPDSNGVLCVPALAGLAAPWWQPAATATISGMTLSTDRGHLVLALLQGIAAQIGELVSAIHDDTSNDTSNGASSSCTQITRLRADGGLTQSRTLMQAVADILQIPVDIYPSPHATALGAAALADLSLHPHKGLHGVLPSWYPTMSYEPQWSADRASEFRSAWRKLADTTYTCKETG